MFVLLTCYHVHVFTSLTCVPQITEKQYFMTALTTRAEMKAWSDVGALFTSRKWLGLTRKKPPLSFQRVVDILQKNSASTQVKWEEHVTVQPMKRESKNCTV